MKRLVEYLLVLSVLFVGILETVQAQGMLDPVTYVITEAPEQVAVSDTFEVIVRADIEGQWHLYSVDNEPDAGPYPTAFSAAAPELSIAGDVVESEPTIELDPNFNAELGWHSGQATFRIPLVFAEFPGEETAVALEVQYQVCDDRTCLPPTTKSIRQAITVTGVAGSAETWNGSSAAEGTGSDEAVSVPSAKQDDQQPSQESEGNIQASGLGGDGIFSFLWIALTAGFAALLTPCVFPMIPLTVSFFSKQSEGRTGRVVGKAFLFGAAIVLTFTILGGLLALLIGASGANKFAANPWVNLFIAGVLIVFAISLLGAFELRLPYQLTNWLNRKSNESSGYIGILFMALTISAVSFSCTAPFVGGVLAATAGGEWFYPIVGMAGFSTAFASPFVVFALFPRWLESLPQSGSWMNIVKVLLGFIELAAAVKFLSNADLVWQWGLISRPFAIATWIAVFLLAGLYVLGMYSINQEAKPRQIGTGRLMLAMPFLLFSFYLIPGLMGSSLGIWDSWLPPTQATDVSVVRTLVQQGGGGSSGGVHENWSSDYKASVETAKQQNKPVFIDFTGYTCTNCRAMETNVFPLENIQQQFAHMEQVRLYTDDGTKGPEYQKFQFELTGTIALPTYAIVDPQNGIVLEQLSGYADKETFHQFLQKGLEEFRRSRS